MSPFRNHLVLPLLILPFLAMPVVAQADRELSSPTATVWNVNMTPTAINNLVSQGWRLTDIEVEDTSPWQFTVAMVPNSGPYQIAWAWYYDVDATTLGNLLSQNRARLIDLEPYDAGGSTRFAAIMVNNTGANARTWGWLYNTTTSAISQNVNQFNNRIVDLDRYTIGSTTYYSAVLTSNTGSDARTWWLGLGLTAAQVSQQVNQNNAQIVDIERYGGLYDVVMQRVPGAPAWWYLFGQTGNQVTEALSQYGARIIDIEWYVAGFPPQVRYDVVMINNSNPLTFRVGEILRNGSDGVKGAYLKQMNGPVLAALNSDRTFEPASSIKLMFHAHAMKQVQHGVSLNSLIPVPPEPPSGCYSFASSTNVDLRQTLRLMMQQSDNPSTVAVQNRFTNDAINATMQGLGLSRTLVRRFLCPTPLNDSTLADFGRLHERIADGVWLTPGSRATQYSLMSEDLGIGGVALRTMIDQEGAALSLPPATVNAFKSECATAWKGGSWNRGAGQIHFSMFLWLKLPFRNGVQINPREYVSGVFLDFASNETNAGNTLNLAQRELLRDAVRAALQTWTDHLPGQFASFGAGCAGSGGTLRITKSGLVEAGVNVTVALLNGRPNSLATLDLGASRSFYNGIPLPLSLGFLGAPGCSLLCSAAIMLNMPTTATGGALVNFRLPAEQALVGATFYGQWLVVGPPVNALGLTTSDGGSFTIGGYR